MHCSCIQRSGPLRNVAEVGFEIRFWPKTFALPFYSAISKLKVINAFQVVRVFFGLDDLSCKDLSQAFNLVLIENKMQVFVGGK